MLNEENRVKTHGARLCINSVQRLLYEENCEVCVLIMVSIIQGADFLSLPSEQKRQRNHVFSLLVEEEKTECGAKNH